MQTLAAPRRLLGLAAAVAALAALAVGVVRVAGGLVTQNRAWVVDLGTRTTPVGAAQLFSDLAAVGALRLDLATFRLDVAPSDCADRLVVAAASGARPEPLCSGPRNDLLAATQRLYQSSAGVTVLAEIAQWNSAFDVLAVRDDRGAAARCANEAGGQGATKAGPSPFALERGCHPTRWKGFVVASMGDEQAVIDVSDRVAPEPEPHLFGFLAAERRPGFGDWLTLATGRLGRSAMRLETVVEPGDGEFFVDIVGDVTAIRFGEVRVDLEAVPTAEQRAVRRPGARPRDVPRPATRRTTAAVLARQQLCLDAGRLRLPTCTPRIVAEGSPRGTRLRIAAGATPQRLVVDAAPVRSVPARLRELRRASFCGAGLTRGNLEADGAGPDCAAGGRELRLVLARPVTESVWLWCRAPVAAAAPAAAGTAGAAGVPGTAPPGARAGGTQCFLAYSDVERTSRRSVPRIAVATGTERLAETTPQRIEVLPATQRLGLLPLVGTGAADHLSLVGQMAASANAEAPVSATLTIDPAIQRIVKEEIEQRLVSAAGQRTQVAAGGLLDRRRRAAIVILDADQRPGEVLAAATWPSLAAGERLAEWDLRALEAWNPPDSPLAAIAWSQNNYLTVPGSVFKPVTALAALQKAARGDETLRRALLGFASAEALRRGMGLGFEDRDIQPDPRLGLRIRNFRGSAAEPTTVGQAFLLPARTGCPGGTAQQIGLCEALLVSSNVWFARLALLMDADDLERAPAGRPADGLALTQMVRRLYPAAPFPLLQPEGFRLGPGTRLAATPVVLDSTIAPVQRLNRRVTLAFNGMGQQTQVTPMAMAAIYASIATGRVVLPRLGRVPQASAPLPTLLLDGVDEVTQERWLAPLRAGLKAVTSSPDGTGRGAFSDSPDLHPFVWGKTGTATVVDNDDHRQAAATQGHTVWFAGWLDTRPSAHFAAGRTLRAPYPRRIAFACMVTHARGGTGGALCAPAVKRILLELSRLEGPRR